MKVTTTETKYTQEQVIEARKYANSNKVSIPDALVALGYKKSLTPNNSTAAGGSSNAATTITSNPTRDAAILDLYKRDKPRAIYIAKVLGSPLKLAGEGLKQIDAITKNLLVTVFKAESQIVAGVGSGIRQAGSGIAGAIDSFGDAVVDKIDTAKAGLNDALAPVSRATGEVLANATKILQNPLGATFALGGSIGHLVDKISPGFTNRLDATYKSLGLQAMSHFPSQVVGSLKDLMSATSAIACLPLTLIGDLNQALIQISQAISGLIDKITAKVYDFFFGPGGVLDGILPIQQIAEFLSAANDIAGTLGAIGVLAGGSASFMNIVGRVSSYSNLAASAFANPAALAVSYLPAGTGSVLGQIRNPQGLLDKIIPPEVNKALLKLKQICAISRSGDLGYALAEALGPAKASALNYLLNKYSSQRDIIAGQLNQSGAPPPQEEYPPKEEKPPIGETPVDTVNKQPSVEAQAATRPNPPLLEASANFLKSVENSDFTQPEAVKLNGGIIINNPSGQPGTGPVTAGNISVTNPTGGATTSDKPNVTISFSPNSPFK